MEFTESHQQIVDSAVEGMKAEHRERHRPYYQELGRAHDLILRCSDCKRLVTYEVAQKLGGCGNCGNRRLTEVRALSAWEWAKIRLGIIRFGNRKEFLKEFRCGRHSA